MQSWSRTSLKLIATVYVILYEGTSLHTHTQAEEHTHIGNHLATYNESTDDADTSV